MRNNRSKINKQPIGNKNDEISQLKNHHSWRWIDERCFFTNENFVRRTEGYPFFLGGEGCKTTFCRQNIVASAWSKRTVFHF